MKLCYNYITHYLSLHGLQCVSMLRLQHLRDQLKVQDRDELERCIVRATIRGFALTAVEIAKVSPHPVEEMMLVVFDHSAKNSTEEEKVVSAFICYELFNL